MKHLKHLDLLLASLLSMIPSITFAATPTCYPMVLAPAISASKATPIPIKEAYSIFNHIPDTINTTSDTRRIKIADGYVEYEIIPATFKEITETVTLARERVELENIPAQFKAAKKRVKIKDATQHWNPACEPIKATSIENIPSSCLQETPAQYQEIDIQTMQSPARVVKKIIPARTQTVTRKILETPAQIIRKEIPAVYEELPLERIEKTASTTATQQPTETTPVTIETQLSAARMTAMPAWCEDKLDPIDVDHLQRRLQQLNYYNGTLSQHYDASTRAALVKFQQDNQLAEGAITLQSLEKLGLQ